MPKKTTKKAVKKVAAKKAPAKKVATKKAVTKKVAAKKVAVKKATPIKKTASKKTALKQTSIIARVDVGFGNSLYIRGEGAGLSWNQGTPLDNAAPYEWILKTTKAKGTVTFKFLINDEIWSEGENLTVTAGGTSVSSPIFNW